MELTERSYWTSKYQHLSSVPVFKWNGGVHEWINYQWHQLFVSVFKNSSGKSLLEIGCGNSYFLPYFHHAFGMEVSGIDYEPTGVDLANRNLMEAKCPATAYHCSLFMPWRKLQEKFDYVVSFGLVEHFQESTEAVRAHAFFLKPGGTLFITAPNMRGINGILQKAVNPKVFSMHIQHDCGTLHKAFLGAGLANIDTKYFCSINTEAVNYEGGYRYGSVIKRLFHLLSVLVWDFEHGFRAGLPAVKSFSPYICATGMK